MLAKFVSESDGAVTVDWVVITAAVVGLGLGAAAVVRVGAWELSKNTATVLQAQVVDLGTLGHTN